jgi:hypothetical protein
MKKIFLSVLAFAGAVTSVCSQQQVIIYPDRKEAKTEQIFNSPTPGSSRIRFDFRMDHGNVLMVELSTLRQIDSIPDLDSLAISIKNTLVVFNDSLADPLAHKRVDVITSSPERIRIAIYPQQSRVFSLKNGEVTQLKVEQDTLRITLWTKRSSAKYYKNSGPAYLPYDLTFLLNNIGDLTNLPFEDITRIIRQVSNEVEKFKGKDKEYSGAKFFAAYMVPSGKNIISHDNLARTGKIRFNLNEPYVQSGFQFMRNSFVPSAGVGIRLTQKKSDQYEREWRLMWEPLFFFSRNADNKLVTDRNDFITFKQYSRDEFQGETKKIVMVQNVSFGYLIRRKGNWFEKNTFKFSLPTGIQYENILLEPEFVFNNFFRHFSPSLKFTVIFE